MTDARDARDDARAALRRGDDPGHVEDSPKAKRAAVDPARLCGTVAAEYFQMRLREGIAPSTQARLARDIAALDAKFGDREVASVEAPEMLALFRAVEDEGKFETAERLRQTAGRIFLFAIASGRATTDPTQALRGALVGRRSKHLPGLTEPKAVGELLRAIRGYGGHPETRIGLLLSAHIFLRSSEIRKASWDEIDWGTARWTVPAERMKMKRKHIVPLSRQAVALLQELHPITGRRDFILPTPVSPTKPLSENAFNQALKRLGYGSGIHVHHGYRTTASTNLNEQGWNADWIEAQLAHVQGSAVRRAYNAAQYLEGRTEMMRAWSEWLEGLEHEDPSPTDSDDAVRIYRTTSV